MAFFRVVALDLDGTLTSHGALSGATVQAVGAAREAGVLVVLASGRIRTELEGEFPGIGDHFDAMVLENGAVAVEGGRLRRLTSPVDPSLADLLDRKGVPCRRGEVLLAVDGTHTGDVADAIAELELDCQIVHNRDAAMVLPAGVTKGSGLATVLRDVNISLHNAIGVGDAENDLSLLESAEVGVAVANAVRSVRRRADLLLDAENGSGVSAFLTGPYVSGARRFCPPRRWIEIGRFDDGSPALVPGSQARLVVTGPSGAGKSYLVGLMAERWILAGYTVLVIDPEGDHVALDQLSDVRVVDAADYLPEPVDLVASLLRPVTSVVLDLSSLAEVEKVRYLRRLRSAARGPREEHGVPHWVIFDEAHLPGAHDDVRWTTRTGYVLASFMPSLIPSPGLERADVVLELENVDDTVGLRFGETRRATVKVGKEPARSFAIGDRRTAHVRHRHKYADIQLPSDRRFYFHVEGRAPVVAGTLQEFRAAVRHLDPGVLEYHLERTDLSRWLADTIADKELAARVAALENDLAVRRAADIERVRRQIVCAVTDRYLADRGGWPTEGT